MPSITSLIKNISLGALALVLIVFVLNSMKQIEEGSRGIKKTWGKVTGDPLTPGFYFYNPISSTVVEMDVKEHKVEGKEMCFTKDTQLVEITYAFTFYPIPDKIGALYSQFGQNWEEKIILPALRSSIKDVVGQYIADDLVSKREVCRTTAFAELKTALETRQVMATRLDFTNLDFDDAYERAVEAKVVAVQRAAESKNKTVQVEEEAKQKILNAKAEAEAMRIKTQALSQNKSLVEYEAVQKWDGKLPETMMGNTVPFIHLSKKQ